MGGFLSLPLHWNQRLFWIKFFLVSLFRFHCFLGEAGAISSLLITGSLLAAGTLGPQTYRAGFTSLPSSQTGITFSNRVSEQRYLTNQIVLNGSGVAFADVDADGRTDVFLAGYGGASCLWHNKGLLAFSLSTASSFPAEVLSRLDGTGVAFADLDGDGDPDLILNTLNQGTYLFLNDGGGHFRLGQIINQARGGTSLSLADVDGDGDLDLYVVNYRGVTVRDDPGAKYQLREEGGRQWVTGYNGRPTTEPDLIGRFSMTPSGPQENGEPDAFFLNDGKGKFSPVSWTDGTFLDENGRPLLSPPYEWGLSGLFRDFNGDGLPDLYVCNDFQSEDRFWINETPLGGTARFRLAQKMALRHTSAFSMGVDGADINRDGREDFIVLDMLSREHWRRQTQVEGLPPGFYQPGVIDDRPQFSHNTLFLGRGDGSFAEIGRLAGVSASEWAWTPLFLDVDLDGWEDLLVSNGHVMDMLNADVSKQAEDLKGNRRKTPRELLELRRLFQPLAATNAAFRNCHNLTFADMTVEWGFGESGVEHGMAAADLDGDGDLDLVLNTFNGPAKILRNDAAAPRLRIQLKGLSPNTRGIGAHVRVRASGLPEQTQQMISGGRYLSADDTVRTFALGTAPTAAVEVRWRSGRVTRIPTAVAGLLTVEEAAATGVFNPSPSPLALFEDVSVRLSHHHLDTAFNDFARQPSITRDLSQGGPGITWTDLNQDGLDDLVISSGQGGAMGVFTNTGQGRFATFANAAFERPTARDLTTVLSIGGALIAGISNYEDARTNGGALRIMNPSNGLSGEVLGGMAAAVGPLAAADIDGDGILEIFVGVRAVAGRYPEPASSFLVRNEGGRLGISARFDQIGLVQGAVFSDLNGDGRPDLAVTCDWGPIKLFQNREGILVPWDPPLRGSGISTGVTNLSQWTGWWHGITAVDADGDGRMDLVVGNWGRNHFLGSKEESRPLRVRYGDFNGDDIVDLVESYVGPTGVELPVRRHELLKNILPALATGFSRLEAYGRATLTELLQGIATNIPVRTALNLDSGILLNRGNFFEWRAFPPEAQVAPVFGTVAADFNGDGIEDLVLTQNFFGIPSDEARYDAGRGLLLLGIGKGDFTVNSDSGIVAWGEQRGAAAADFDGDGRMDLAVGQNLTATRLFRNTNALPGLRVHLQGSAGNPESIGASLRWITASGPGPRRELHAGAGWWSVDSSVTVLGTQNAAGEVEVRWPGGRLQRHRIKAGTRTLILPQTGEPPEASPP
ncbi:MAG: hypothetical protein EXS25_03015 [Pedosphaera sp.]|nr:hypothetical protein [Pedosphaera sp.]